MLHIFKEFFSTTAHSKQDSSGNPPESARSQRGIRTKAAAAQSCKPCDLIAKILLCIFEDYFSTTAHSKQDNSSNLPQSARSQGGIRTKAATAQSGKPRDLIAKIFLCIFEEYFTTTAHSKQDGSSNLPESARSQKGIRTKVATAQSCKPRDLIAKILLCIFEEYFTTTAHSKQDGSSNLPESARSQKGIRTKAATAQSCKPCDLIAKILLCIFEEYFSTTAHSKQDGSSNLPESARSQKGIRMKAATAQSCKSRDLIAKILLCIFEEYFSTTAHSKQDGSSNLPESARSQGGIRTKAATAQSCKPRDLIAKVLLCIFEEYFSTIARSKQDNSSNLPQSARSQRGIRTKAATGQSSKPRDLIARILLCIFEGVFLYHSTQQAGRQQQPT